MARKFYLTNNAPPVYDPGAIVRGAWDDTTNATLSGGLRFSPSGAWTTTAVAETNASPTWDVNLAHWTSEQIGRNFTMGGTVRWVIPVSASNAAASFKTHIHIWVTQGQSTNLRGTLLSNWIGTTDWSTTIQGVAEGTVLLSEVQVQKGDFIVVEFGYQAQNSVTTSYTGTQGFGSDTPSEPDLSNGDTTVTTRPSWVEFSQDFTLAHSFPNNKLRPRPFSPGIAR